MSVPYAAVAAKAAAQQPAVQSNVENGSGSDKGKQPMVCHHCGQVGHIKPNCPTNEKRGGKGNHRQNGRKAAKVAQQPQQQIAAQFADLESKLGGEKMAHREAARERDDFAQENEILRARLAVAERAVDATRERHTARVAEWQANTVIRYSDEQPIILSDFKTQLKVLVAAKTAFAGATYAISGLQGWAWWPLYLGAWYWCLALVVVGLLWSIVRDYKEYRDGKGPGGVFRAFNVWEYRFDSLFDHVHDDQRTDAEALQDIKHAARYARFNLRKGLGLGKMILAPMYNKDVVVSIELFTQIATAKNIDPYLKPEEARAALQRSSAHNNTVNIDRNLILREENVKLETVSLAYLHYLKTKCEWAKRDFLPSLPQ